MDHESSLCYVIYLEDFTSKLIVQAKKDYEYFATSYRNEVKLYHADNGQFSDQDFIAEIRENY